MAPFGAISLRSLPVVSTMLDDHHFLSAVMPTAMPPTIMVEIGVSAAPMIATPLDDDRFSICNGRGRNSNRGQRGKDVSKLLHDVLLRNTVRKKHRSDMNVPGETA
jgi:hypothetical protein